MTTEESIIYQFDRFLRQFFPLSQFRLLVQQWPHLRAIATAVSDAHTINDAAVQIDFKSLADCLDGVVVERAHAEQPITVIEGQFKGRKSKLTIVMPAAVPA